ncbi:CRTAC1 family protein [Botrimarina sp.]|uniref:CRTAC1 family protein n=1 Tax=Botrimarina sp. TaxID=2795802 RepID=UPI0032F01985
MKPLRSSLGGAVCVLLIATQARAQRFTDVTLAAGITHVHATPEAIAALPGESFMAGGVAAGDFTGDGLVDLVFTRLGAPDLLYRNLGGTFEPMTLAAGFTTATDTNGVASGDFDNDGDLDLYMTGVYTTRNYLYVNNGAGVFTDAGPDHSAAVATGATRFGQGVSFGDYNADGLLDIVTAAWGDSTDNSHSRLLKNLGPEGGWAFDDVTDAAGLDVFRGARSYRFSPRLVDLDRDGHADLPIASDFMTSQLFWSDGQGGFVDGTLPSGVGTDLNGMGSTFGDYDGDGDLDWFITNITNSPDNPGAHGGWNRLYRNDGDRRFTDVTGPAGVRDSRWAWGTSFFDYDNDGDLDLVATNGWNGTGWADDQTKLWRNDDGVFTDASTEEGVVDRLQGRGLAHLDYDGDGDLDLVVINNAAAPVLYRNDGPVGGHLRVQTRGVQSNRDGVGAWITVTPDAGSPSERMVWEVDGGSSFLSQNERTAHFGLGDHEGPVDLVTVVWPSGQVQQIFGLDSNQTILAIEADTAEVADFNHDGRVDAADYTLWRDARGHSGPHPADASGDSLVDATDYLAWVGQYGRPAPLPGSQAPEPSGAWLALAAAPWWWARRRR